MTEKEPYFAPPAEGAPPEGEVPTWGEDATAIAREAGLGSYGADREDQVSREEALINASAAERTAMHGVPSRSIEEELASLKRTVSSLCVLVCVLGIAMVWLALLATW